MNAKVENLPVCTICNLIKFFHCQNKVKYNLRILLIDEDRWQLENSHGHFFIAKNKGKVWCHQTHQESRYLLCVIKTIKWKWLTLCYHFININLKSSNTDKHYFVMFFGDRSKVNYKESYLLKIFWQIKLRKTFKILHFSLNSIKLFSELFAVTRFS